MKKIIIGLLAIVIILGGGFLVIENTKPSIYKVKNITTELVQENKDYYIYFTSPKCGYCTTMEEYMLEKYNELESSDTPIYVVDTSKEGGEIFFFDPYDENKYSSKEELPKELNVTNLRIVGTPSLYLIKDGKVVDMGIGEKGIKEILDKDKQ